MIISFYDRNFSGLQNNASLVVDTKSYSLIRRGVELDELKCTCEPFTENIQPTFVVVKNDVGNYVYGCLAGIPETTTEKKTVINGTDLKSMFKSDVLITEPQYHVTANAHLSYVFNLWNTQVNQNTIPCTLTFDRLADEIELEFLSHNGLTGKYNAWTDLIAPYLKYYGFYMTARVDLITKQVVFTIGKSMLRDMTIKLWEHGIYNYGKWVASLNEAQGVVYRETTGSYTYGTKWILLSDNTITTNAALRDIFPVKRQVVLKEAGDDGIGEKMNEANTEALEKLCGSLFNENIEIPGITADFETRFNITVNRGDGIYKSLPCGELHYDASGLTKVQIGYRFSGLQFIL